MLSASSFLGDLYGEFVESTRVALSSSLLLAGLALLRSDDDCDGVCWIWLVVDLNGAGVVTLSIKKEKESYYK